MNINDPANYRELSAPFTSIGVANAALKAFFDDVRAARQKHRIADVLTVVSVNVAYDSGEGTAMSHSTNGDVLKAQALAAYAYGVEQSESRERMARLVAGKGMGAK